jgi:hypothetical protein
MIDQDELHDDRPLSNARAFSDVSSGGLGLLFKTYRCIAGRQRVALRSAVAEPGSDIAQIAALADRLRATPAENSPEWRPAIDQHEFHVAPPIAKQ